MRLPITHTIHWFTMDLIVVLIFTHTPLDHVGFDERITVIVCVLSCDYKYYPRSLPRSLSPTSYHFGIEGVCVGGWVSLSLMGIFKDIMVHKPIELKTFPQTGTAHRALGLCSTLISCTLEGSSPSHPPSQPPFEPITVSVSWLVTISIHSEQRDTICVPSTYQVFKYQLCISDYLGCVQSNEWIHFTENVERDLQSFFCWILPLFISSSVSLAYGLWQGSFAAWADSASQHFNRQK